MGRRLLVVSDTLVGGQGGATVRHAAWFGGRGWDVTVVAPSGESTALEAPNHLPLAMPATARDARGVLRAARELGALCHRVRPDVVHCHGARAFLVARVSGVRRPFVTLHGIMPVSTDPPGYRVGRRAGLALVPPFAAGAFSVSPDAPRGWVFTPHASDRLAGMATLGPPTAPRPTFLWVGRLDEPKRPDVFVRAIAAVDGARGLMAGTGPLESSVRRLIAEECAAVELLGHRRDIPDLMAEAWAVALFSDHEGVPFSLEEAMWAGRAVVASPVAGIRWLVGDDRQLAGNVAGAAAAMRALSTREMATEIGTSNAERVRDLLTADDPWPDLERRYQ